MTNTTAIPAVVRRTRAERIEWNQRRVTVVLFMGAANRQART